MKREITREQLKEILDYDSSTGVFTWRETPNTKRNRSKIAGSPAYNRNKTHEYVKIKVCGKAYMAHRLAWFYTKGEWPKQLIDHINGDSKDNRIENLREATHCQNSHNRKGNRDSKTGYKGVYKHVKSDKYVAEIMYNGKRKYLGIFDTVEQAHEAYVAASKQHHAEYSKTS